MTILVIEDDTGINLLLTERLEADGFDVICFTTAAEALAYLSGHFPLLMVLDYSLPDMNGHEFIDELKQRGIKLPPFIVSTGHGSEHIAVKMMKLGARDYVVKDSYFLDILPGEINRLYNEISNENKRQQAEAALRESEEKYRNLFESLYDIYYFTDVDGRINLISPSVEREFSYTPNELKGQNIRVFYNIPQARDEFISLLRKNGAVTNFETQFKHKDNSLLWISINARLAKDEKGNPIGIEGVIRNITKRKKMENGQRKLEIQLQQAYKMEAIGTLAGGIAHDFNNILFPILGHAEMLMEDLPEDSTFRHGLNGIYSGALRARDLVTQILTFSRQERSESKLMKIQPIVREALKFIRSSIPSTIEIKQDINGGSVIKADPTQVHQIVMNLTTNAYHAMEETGGQMTVSLKEVELKELDLIEPDTKPGNYICLSVTDTGVGMHQYTREKIFDPFFTTKEKGKGTGMGLSVVHGIVKRMGGIIRVLSTPGRGTHFYVYLPVEKSTRGQDRIQAKEQPPKGCERILLVDDEPAIIAMEEQMLTRLGYQVTSQISSLAALEAFRLGPGEFDMVITDMAMPQLSGEKLSIELIKIRRDIPILLCTGFSETMDVDRVRHMGIKGTLLKPIVMQTLSQKIRRILDKQNLEMSLELQCAK